MKDAIHLFKKNRTLYFKNINYGKIFETLKIIANVFPIFKIFVNEFLCGNDIALKATFGKSSLK